MHIKFKLSQRAARNYAHNNNATNEKQHKYETPTNSYFEYVVYTVLELRKHAHCTNFIGVFICSPRNSGLKTSDENSFYIMIETQAV